MRPRRGEISPLRTLRCGRTQGIYIPSVPFDAAARGGNHSLPYPTTRPRNGDSVTPRGRAPDRRTPRGQTPRGLPLRGRALHGHLPWRGSSLTRAALSSHAVRCGLTEGKDLLPLPFNVAIQEAEKRIKKLLALLAKAAAAGAARCVDSFFSDPKNRLRFRQPEAISEVFSIHQGHNIRRRVGKSMQELVKVFLDFCKSELPPTPALADPAGSGNPAPAIQDEAMERFAVVGGGDQGALTPSTGVDLIKDPDIIAAVPLKTTRTARIIGTFTPKISFVAQDDCPFLNPTHLPNPP
ncbi:hypothetical protein OF83DRAFT_1086038 [Amylostereum chailletii]|nr:hypothetical protein OF83DRAFT_1086038 [Amylostereum chailletii]